MPGRGQGRLYIYRLNTSQSPMALQRLRHPYEHFCNNRCERLTLRASRPACTFLTTAIVVTTVNLVEDIVENGVASALWGRRCCCLSDASYESASACRLELTPLNTATEGVAKAVNRKIWEDVLSVMRIRTFQIIVLQVCPSRLPDTKETRSHLCLHVPLAAESSV